MILIIYHKYSKLFLGKRKRYIQSCFLGNVNDIYLRTEGVDETGRRVKACGGDVDGTGS
jgi:hypothetical protein